MIIRALDNNDDWVFGNGKSSYKSDFLALIQNIKTKLLEWKGDCFFDNLAGIDWKNRLTKRQEEKPLQEEIRVLISKINGVKEVLNIDLNYNEKNRKLKIEYAIKTIYSDTTELNNIEII
jgi:hypothetical protein